MNFLAAFFRALLFLIVLTFAPGALLWLVFGAVGFLGVLFVFLVFLAVCGLFAERLIVLFFPVQKRNYINLSRMLERVSNLDLHQAPKIFSYSDPSPNLLVVRSIFGRGTILVSQGLLSILGEDEIDLVLSIGLNKLSRKAEIRGKSLVSAAELIILQILPGDWVWLFNSHYRFGKKNFTPLRTMLSLIFAPFIVAMITIAEFGSDPIENSIPPFILSKIKKEQHWFDFSRAFSCSSLYMMSPE